MYENVKSANYDARSVKYIVCKEWEDLLDFVIKSFFRTLITKTHFHL